jgi:hypothetical protein
MSANMVKKIRKKKQVNFFAKKGDIERTDYDDGTRTLSMSPELEDAFQEQRKLFIEKFGREPNDDDPIFFDPDADTPQPYSEEKYNEELIEAMRRDGVDERYINAWRKTGLLVTQENIDLMTPEELAEFEAAMDEEELE